MTRLRAAWTAFRNPNAQTDDDQFAKGYEHGLAVAGAGAINALTIVTNIRNGQRTDAQTRPELTLVGSPR